MVGELFCQHAIYVIDQYVVIISAHASRLTLFEHCFTYAFPGGCVFVCVVLAGL